MFDNEDVFIDTDLIRSALNEIKENPNIQTVARFDEEGNYVIKKIRTEKQKLSFRERLKFSGKTKDVQPKGYLSAREYGNYINQNNFDER